MSFLYPSGQACDALPPKAPAPVGRGAPSGREEATGVQEDASGAPVMEPTDPAGHSVQGADAVGSAPYATPAPHIVHVKLNVGHPAGPRAVAKEPERAWGDHTAHWDMGVSLLRARMLVPGRVELERTHSPKEE